jgi:hypothetical protein
MAMFKSRESAGKIFLNHGRFLGISVAMACALFLCVTNAFAQAAPAFWDKIDKDKGFIISAQELGIKSVKLMATNNVSDFKVPVPKEVMNKLMNGTQAATFQIDYLDTGDACPSGCSDTYIAWPQNAKDAFEYAYSIWGAQITSAVPVHIKVGWVDNLEEGILGHSTPLSFFHDSTYLYPVSLANALTGSDLDTSKADMYIGFSSTFDWYYGTDAAPPYDKFDMVSVSLHEICHGLGFMGTFWVESGVGSWGWGDVYPMIYDPYIVNGSGQQLINTSNFANNSAALAAQLQGDNLFFAGTNATTANGGNPPGIYAPSTWNGGSSLSHLGEVFNNTVNALMTYSSDYGEAVHDTGPVTRGILQDIGWTIGGGGATTTTTIGGGSTTTTIGGGSTTTTIGGGSTTTTIGGMTTTTTIGGMTTTTTIGGGSTTTTTGGGVTTTVQSTTTTTVSNSCIDNDGDGYGINCANGMDCNDQNANMNPGLAEICGDGIDNNCNGFTDED